MNIYNISPTLPYLEEVANYILQNYDGKFTELTVFLPTRRSCRALQEMLIHRSSKKATLLPSILPIGDNITNELDDSFQDLELIGKIEQKLIITKIIAESKMGFSLSQASSLSNSIINLFNEIESEKIDVSKLEELDISDLAGHWSSIKEFLTDGYNKWQTTLSKKGQQNFASYRNNTLNNITNSYNNQHVIIAGSTGSMRSVREFIKFIAGQKNGKVILPPIDLELDDCSWEEINLTHAHYHIKELLEFCEISRTEVKQISQEDKQLLLRSKLIQNIALPGKGALGDYNTNDIEYINAASPLEEAALISTIIRKLHTSSPNEEIALVTHNENLIKNVEIYLKRFNIEIDNSLGINFRHSNIASFFFVTLDVALSNFSIIKLLEFLKHPLVRSNYAEAIEHALRGNFEVNNSYEIKKILRKSGNVKITEYFDILEQQFLEIFNLCNADEVSLHKLISSCLHLMEEINPNLWRYSEAETAVSFFKELLDSSQYFPTITISDTKTILDNLFSGIRIRAKLGWSPKIVALNPVEVRFTRFKHVILADLNEDSWPQNNRQDPWMNNSMREFIGLPNNKSNISKSFHDFYLCMHCPNVFITRSNKKDGAETTPSRFLMKLLSYIDRNLPKESIKTKYWDSQYKSLFAAHSYTSELGLASLPKECFPKKIAATNLEMLIKNPYGFYAKKALSLYKLDDLEQEETAADFGNFIHETFEDYCNDYHKLEMDKYSAIIKISEGVLRKMNLPEFISSMWRPKFKRIAEEFIVYDQARREKAAQIFVEIEGKMNQSINGVAVSLTGKADRIELGEDGLVSVIDYKTGVAPSKLDVARGHSPQLLLESLIAKNGGFKEFKCNGAIEMVYIKINSGKPYITENIIEFTPELEEAANNGILDLLKYFTSDAAHFLPSPNPAIKMRYNDYKHLAREE